MYYIILLVIIGIDQIVKAIIASSMTVGQSIPVIQNIFHITYIQNTGAAFSMMSGRTVLVAIFTAVVLIGLLASMIYNYKKMDKVLKLCYALIISGGLGNLIDRFSRGFVVDMFDFRVWPVFNVADIAICVGCGLLLLYVIILEPRKNKSKNGK